MKTFNDLEFSTLPEVYGIGKRARMMFDNGYGVSVVRTDMTYGGKEGLYELGVLDDPKGSVVSYTSVTNDVLGWLTEDEVTKYMIEVQELNDIFLSTEQMYKLKEKEWSVIPSCAYISLAREDFKEDSVWEDICDILRVQYDDQVTVLCIAKQVPIY